MSISSENINNGPQPSLSIQINEKNKDHLGNDIFERELAFQFDALKKADSSAKQLYQDFFRIKYFDIKGKKEGLEEYLKEKKDKKHDTVEEKKALIGELLGIHNLKKVERLGEMGQGVANLAYLLVQTYLRLSYNSELLDIKFIYLPETQETSFTKVNEETYVYEHIGVCAAILYEEHCLILNADNGEILEIKLDAIKSNKNKFDLQHNIMHLIQENEPAIKCKPFFKTISKSVVIFNSSNENNGGQDFANNLQTNAILDIRVDTYTNSIKYINSKKSVFRSSHNPFFSVNIPIVEINDEGLEVSRLTASNFASIPANSQQWLKEIEEMSIHIEEKSLNKEVIGDLDKEQVRQYIKIGERLLVKLSLIKENELEDQLHVDRTWTSLPAFLSEYNNLFDITKLGKIKLTPFAFEAQNLNNSLLVIPELSGTEVEYTDLPYELPRRNYLAAIVCIGWALYNRAALIEKEFERGSYTILTSIDNQPLEDFRLYDFLLGYVKLVNRTNEVHVETFLKHTTNFLIWQNQFGYSRNPTLGASSHYKNEPLQFGIDMRFNKNEWSLCVLPWKHSHFLFGRIKTGTFLKPERVGIGLPSEKALHLRHYSSGEQKIMGRSAREKDIPEKLKEIYIEFCNKKKMSCQKNLPVQEMFKSIGECHDDASLDCYKKFLQALKDLKIHLPQYQWGSEVRLVLSERTLEIQFQERARAELIEKQIEEQNLKLGLSIQEEYSRKLKAMEEKYQALQKSNQELQMKSEEEQNKLKAECIKTEQFRQALERQEQTYKVRERSLLQQNQELQMKLEEEQNKLKAECIKTEQFRQALERQQQSNKVFEKRLQEEHLLRTENKMLLESIEAIKQRLLDEQIRHQQTSQTLATIGQDYQSLVSPPVLPQYAILQAPQLSAASPANAIAKTVGKKGR